MKPFFPYPPASDGQYRPAAGGFAALADATLRSTDDLGTTFQGTFQDITIVLGGLPGHHKTIKQCFQDLTKQINFIDAIPTTDIDNEIQSASASAGPGLDAIAAELPSLLQNPSWSAGLAPAPAAPTYGALGIPSGGTNPGLTSPGQALAAATIGASLGAAATIAAGAGVATFLPLATIAVAAPIVGAAIALVLLALSFFHGGCGDACINAAKTEQIYESAADNIGAAFRQGLITRVQAITGMKLMIQLGQQHEQQYGTKQADKGAAHLTTIIEELIGGVSSDPQPAPQKFSLEVAREYYVQPQPGWYPDALQAGAQVADSYLDSLQPPKGK